MPKHRLWTTALVLSLTMAAVTPAPANGWWKVLGWLDEMSGPGPFGGFTLAFEHCIGRTPPDVLEQFAVAAQAVTQFRLMGVPLTERQLREQAEAEQRMAQAALELRTAFCKMDRSNQRLAVSYEWAPRLTVVRNGEQQQYEGDMYAQRHVGVAYMTLSSLLEALRLVDPKAIALNRTQGPGSSRWLRSIELGTGFGMHRYYGSAVIRESLWRPVIPLRIRVNVGGFYPERWPARRALSPLSYRYGWDFTPGILYPDDFVYVGDPRLRFSRGEFVPTWGVAYDLVLLWKGKK